MRTPCPDEQVLACHRPRLRPRRPIEASELLAVWLTERLYLPDAARERFDRIEADYVAEWQRWLSVARPDLPDVVASSLVRTTKTVIDDCARIQRLQRLPIFPAELTTAALATLGLPGVTPPHQPAGTVGCGTLSTSTSARRRAPAWYSGSRTRSTKAWRVVYRRSATVSQACPSSAIRARPPSPRWTTWSPA